MLCGRKGTTPIWSVGRRLRWDMAKVYLINSAREGEVFVSLERTPLVLAEVRKALPQLQTALQAKWPNAAYVDIEERRLRLRNPFHGVVTREMLEAIGIVLAVRFAVSASDAAGKEFGKGITQEVGRYVRRWLRQFSYGKTKTRARSGHKKNPRLAR